MTTLFDQDYVTARYGDERERIGMNKEKKETAVNMLTLRSSLAERNREVASEERSHKR